MKVTVRTPLRPFATIRDRRRTPARWKVSSTDLLLQERKEDRTPSGKPSFLADLADRRSLAKAAGFRVHG